MKTTTHRARRIHGFTLVELLVVILIVVMLAVLAITGSRRFIENGRKVKTMAMFRDFKVGMALFEGDYGRPPIPENKRTTGWDTIYGDPGGQISTQFLISVLAGEDETIPYVGDISFSTRQTNPRQEAYMTFPYAPDKRGGVAEDGRLYDPWGREVMVAVNTFNAPGQTLRDFNNGQNDRRLNTWGWAEYSDTKPRDESYAFWSYGKDGKKGDNAPRYWDVVPYQGSDDVISW
ncbi:MAG TPA: type II secretion system protein [Luteolibacter sp.]|nr:type II secretion system protein [Luteolibacter sp.]